LAFVWTHRVVDLNDASSATLEELKSTGEYAYLSNQKLKEEINAYYQDWYFRFGQKAYDYTRNIIEDWQNLLMDKGIFNSNPFKKGDPIMVLKNNPPLIGRLRGLASEASWHSMSVKIIYDNAIQLQEQLAIAIADM
jgi:hypothetical protein